MKRVSVLFIILILLANTCAFAQEINIEPSLPHPCEPKSLGDNLIYSSCEADTGETIYHIPPSLPETYCSENEVSLMEDGSFEDDIINTWKNLDTLVDVYNYGISPSDIGDAYRKIVYENPIYYYVSTGFSYRCKNGIVREIYPDYTETDFEAISETTEKINAATEEILFLIDSGMNDFEKIMTVHDYMVLHYEYDYTYTNRNLTIMLTKTGVCMAYTFAFTHLMNQLGIETKYVSSGDMNHAWNLVKLDGRWYHIDLTWDDPAYDYWVYHTYALLSDDCIQSLESPHYDYNLGDLSADSSTYDNASWHSGISSVVTVNDVSYWINGNNLVNENNDIIFENLDGGDSKWSLGNGWLIKNAIYASLGEYNSKLYFNTDTAVYCYDPDSDVTTKISDTVGICGMYIEKNSIVYELYNAETGLFEPSGSICLGNTRYSHPYIEDDKLIARIYKDNDEPLKVFSLGGGSCGVTTIEDTGLTTLKIDATDDVYLFYWDENLAPLCEKVLVENK